MICEKAQETIAWGTMENTTKTYTVEIKQLPHAQIELKVSIPATIFDATRSEAIKHISTDVELPGFRKGHVPEHILVTKLGEGTILEEMAEIAIRKTYPAIVMDEKLDVLGRPEVRITKIASGNPLELTIITAVFPEVKLPDYKKLAAKATKEKEVIAVTDAEVEKTIEQIRRMSAGGTPEGDGKEPAAEIALPPLDDAFIKTLGDFASVDEFKAKIRENLLHEKERAAKDKKRIAIIDAILKDATIDLPLLIVEQELARMSDEFAQDVARMGLTMEKYLELIKKTKEELEKDWMPDAEKRAKTQLTVSKIAEMEKCEPDEETLKKEVAALRMRYPDAPEDRAEGYVRMLLTNEKVFQLLESSGE